MTEDQLGRQDPAAQRCLRAVQVREQSVEEPRALNQARLDRDGVVRRDQKRDRVEFPRALHPARVTVNVISNAVLPDQVLGFLPAPFQLGQSDRIHLLEKRMPMRAQAPIGGDYLVKRTRRTLVVESGQDGVGV